MTRLGLARLVAIASLTLLALALRIAWIFDLRASPLFEGLQLDQANYDAWAQRIAAGDVLGDGVFTSNPLSPYLLGLIYALVGRDLLWVRVIQACVDTLTCLLLYRIARQTVGTRAACCTLALGACYGPLVHNASNLVAEVWVLFFAAGAMALLVGSPVSAWRTLAAGALFALGTLGRPNLLALLPLMPLAGEWARPGSSRRARAGRVAAWFIGVSLVLGPVLARNLDRGGEAVLVSAHGGVNVWIGNNPGADGLFKTPKGSGLAGGQESLVRTSIEIAEADLGRDLTASEVSQWWTRRAARWAWEEPVAFLQLQLVKLRWFISAYEAPLETSYAWALSESRALRWGTVGFGLVGPLAILGLVSSMRRWRDLAPMLAFGLVYSATVVLTFVAGRYRLPALVAMLPLAGLGLARLANVVVQRRWRPLAARLALLLVGVGLAHLPLPPEQRARDRANILFQVGSVLLDRDDPAAALENFEEAVRLYPDHAQLYNNLGLALIRAGQPARAAEMLERGIALGAKGRKIWRNLAKARLDLGDREGAVLAWEGALEQSPTHASTWEDLGDTLAELERREEALAAYRNAMTNTDSETAQARLRRQMARLQVDTP